MKCWDEESIELAAIRLLDLEKTGGEVPKDLRELTDHASTCFRCRELLKLFREMEVRFRVADEEAARDQRDGEVRILALSPIEPRSEEPPPAQEDWEGQTAAPLAADTQPERGSVDEEAPSRRVLSLVSEDGQFLVRIFENERAAGATAILMSQDDPSVPGASPLPFFAAKISIRYADEECPFDAEGNAQLPVFPRSDMRLVIRQ